MRMSSAFSAKSNSLESSKVACYRCRGRSVGDSVGGLPYLFMYGDAARTISRVGTTMQKRLDSVAAMRMFASALIQGERLIAGLHHRLFTGPVAPFAPLFAFFSFVFLVAFAAFIRATFLVFCALFLQASHLSPLSNSLTVMPFFSAVLPIPKFASGAITVPRFIIGVGVGAAGFGASKDPLLFALRCCSRNDLSSSLIGAAYIPSRLLLAAFRGVGRTLRRPSRSNATPTYRRFGWSVGSL